MARLTKYCLEEIMSLPLPSITSQKRLEYRPTLSEVYYVYELLNEEVFDCELNVPKIEVAGYRRKYWGMCVGHWDQQKSGSYCDILLMDKYFCAQWLVAIIAHEMVHQHQWDIETPRRLVRGKPGIMSHGPTFFRFKEKLEQFQIPLKSAHSMRRWFKNQNLFKC